MKNRVVMFGLLVFLLVGVVSASGSVDVEFNINGCNFDFGGENIGVAAGECSGGVAAGYFYCGTDTTPYVTTVDPRGCSFGASSYTPGDDYCCPAGMRCNETTLLCDIRAEACVDQETEEECENNGCVWLDLIGECSDSARNFDCSYYNNENDCENDEWDLGSDGIGTELCGTYIECAGTIFSISEESCGCVWYSSAPEGDKCQLKMNATERFYDPYSDPNKFDCSNVYDLGECTDGVQDVTWYSTVNVLSGFEPTFTVPEECLDALGCNGGETTRFCGEPLIKLPGFSFFSLIASVFAIGLYYLFLETSKRKRGLVFS